MLTHILYLQILNHFHIVSHRDVISTTARAVPRVLPVLLILGPWEYSQSDYSKIFMIYNFDILLPVILFLFLGVLPR